MSALFVDLLGEVEFSKLPEHVQALHRASGTRVYRGEARVVRGTSWLARLCGFFTSQPPAAQQVKLQVEIVAKSRGERWTREFAGHPMRSTLWARDGLLCERLGLVTFAFALSVEAGQLFWRVHRVSALGIPLPARWFEGVCACESEIDDRYHFDVVARMPMAGLLVHYKGWLHVD